MTETTASASDLRKFKARRKDQKPHPKSMEAKPTPVMKETPGKGSQTPECPTVSIH